VAYVNDLYRNGHEIASHAVGHFNGAAWSAGDWQREFRAFGDIVDNVVSNNGLPESKLAFGAADVIGFRAPYLAKGAGLYSALRANGFRYDTSGVGHADAWPEKVDGLWRFNLAMLRIQGLGRGTLSMDYNFFVAQSRAADDPRRYEAAREQMLQTYLHYFKTNYAGNRAPLHIGHHFMNYQGGAYNEAEVFRACGLRAARGALRHLCQARRLHGPAECGNPCRLPQGRLRACRHPDAERGGGRAIVRDPAFSVARLMAVRDYPTLPISQPNIARLRVRPQ